MPLLELQSKRMGESVSDMARMIDEQEAHIAFAWDVEAKKPIAMLGWRIIGQGEHRVGEVLWLAGANLRLWLSLGPEVEQFMREHQLCTKIRAYGRKGWERVMKQYDYRQTAVVIEKELT
jgi:hypothetical protein